MGYNPYAQPAPAFQPNEGNLNSSNYTYSPAPAPSPVGYTNQAVHQQPFAPPGDLPPNFNPNNPYMNTTPQTQLGGVFSQPIVQDMALQYGSQLANTGKTIVKQGIEQYVPITRLKYYFAVDTKYVVSKLGLLFFPFVHSDWSVKYEQDGNPVQPRFELNAPDLYIPTMAYFTYVLVAGLVLGMQQRFSPEQIVMQASSALAWCLVELAVYSCTLYITNIQTSLRTLDLLAYSGYKFIGIIGSIVVSLLAGRTGYYATLIYLSLALAFFLARSLKAQVLQERQTQYYGEAPTGGNKRRLYFLLFVSFTQPALSWWLSFHLLKSSLPVLPIPS